MPNESQEIKSLKERVASLENSLRQHRHSGTDGSSAIDLTTVLSGTSSLRLGDNLDMSAATTGRPASIEIGSGTSDRQTGLNQAQLPMTIIVADQPDLKSATRFGGLGFGSDSSHVTRLLLLGSDSFNPGSGATSSTFFDHQTQLDIVGRNPDTNSYIAAYMGPSVFGNHKNVTAGTATLTDSSLSMPSNKFVGAHLTAVSNSTGRTNTRQVISHTGTVFTVNANWDFTDTDVSYGAYFVIPIGASFLVLDGLRLGWGAQNYLPEIKCPAWQDNGLLIHNLNNTSNTTVSGTARTVRLRMNQNEATKNIESSTNASPINIKITGHGFQENDKVTINSHTVNTNANNEWYIHVVDANNFTLYSYIGPSGASTGNGVGGATGICQRIETFYYFLVYPTSSA